MATNEAERMERAHAGTYNFFIGLMKYGAIICVVVAFLVILIIRN